MRRPWRSMRKLGRQLLAGPYLVWIIGFILLPIVIILYYAFTNTSGAFTWDNIAAIADPVHVKSILLSLKLGFFCTVVCLLLAYPLAMILNSFHFKHQSFVVFLFVLPMWMNFMLRILAWRLLLSNNGIVNALFGLFGFGPVKMLNTPTAVVFGMVYDFLPFMILPIYNSIARIKPDVIEAAKDLGANSRIVLIRIIFPLTLSGVISGIVMVFVGLFFSKAALLLMDTPSDVIGQSALYMRIYFAGMPFFMLYNYGAAILRAVGDTKRPLFFLIIAGIVNAALNLFLVIVLHLGVAGVAIATVIAQMISCLLVLRCLYRSDGSYQLRFSAMTIKWIYLKQIFQVGIPAGIQSTVINFSNVLLQSSVNSFGSIAMAGYTAANNIFGFLYAAANSITQACMSFTSQNFGVGKYKRMDRVLIDCMILSVGAALVLGCGAYFFGAEILQIYTEEADVIQCGVEILSITTVPYFLCGIMDLFPGALRGMGYSAVPMVLSIIGTVGMRVLWIFAFFPQHRSLYFLFISYPASWIATIVMQVVCYYFVRKHCYK